MEDEKRIENLKELSLIFFFFLINRIERVNNRDQSNTKTFT